MTKHQKKPSLASRQKLEEAHRKHEFFSGIANLCLMITGNRSIYKLIPQSKLEFMYTNRIRSPKITADEPSAAGKALHRIKPLIVRCFKTFFVPVTASQGKMTVYDYYRLGLPLYAAYCDSDRCISADEKVVFKALLPFTDFHQKETEHLTALTFSLLTVSVVLTQLDSVICWPEYIFPINADNDAFLCPIVHIHSQPPELLQVDYNGKNRQAMRLGWGYSNGGISWVRLKPAEFGIHGFADSYEMDVYFQQHAMDRLRERMDCVSDTYLHYDFYLSIKNPEIIKGPNKQYLIAFYLTTIKTGYLLADIHDNKVIIRTFLFLTNDGTPEGEKLVALTGLGRLDKEYLLIDKLSTFQSEAMKNNAKVKQVFIEAGCRGLFQIKQEYIQKKSPGSGGTIADRIEAYLAISADQQERAGFPDEDDNNLRPVNSDSPSNKYHGITG